MARRLDPNKATMIIDVSTGKMLRAKDEDLTTAQQKEVARTNTLKEDLTKGVFLNDHVQKIFERTITNMMVDMKNISDGVNPASAGVSIFGAGYEGDIGYLDAIGELAGTSTGEIVESFEAVLKEYQETGLINLPRLQPIHGGTEAAKRYNSDLNTLRALSEVYMMNYDPILSLENEKAKIETGFWEVNEKGESYKDQALKQKYCIK